MPASRFPRVAALAAALFVAAAEGCSHPNPARPPAPLPAGHRTVRSVTYTTGLFRNCPPEGEGGDPDLNRMKNRDVAPPSYESIIIPDILADSPADAESLGREHRSRWPESARQEIADWENRGVSIEGYLLKARHMEPESCNCHAEDMRDYHLWIGQEPGEDRATSLIAEVSPRLMPAHPNWRLRILSRLARDRARVRIGGWLMWDQEHPEQVGKTRGTMWEVHPIHKIEVFSGGVWRDLDG